MSKRVSFNETNEIVVFDETTPTNFIGLSIKEVIPMKNNTRKSLPPWYKHIISCYDDTRRIYPSNIKYLTKQELKKDIINKGIDNIISKLKTLDYEQTYELRTNCYHKRYIIILQKRHISWLESIRV